MAVAALLVAEALSSLATGRSLLDHGGWRAGSLPGWAAAGFESRAPTQADRAAAAARNPGLYRVHVDPFVSYVLRAGAEQTILDGVTTSDEHGLRVRPGPPPPPGAFRIVVLGDSVAFGFGLDDDETLAARLESRLAQTRPAAARPVVCHTVAVPGWTHRNAVHYLLDHVDRLAPDLVLFVPIHNDLTDASSVYETGHRRLAPDLGNPDPFMVMSERQIWPFMRPVLAELGLTPQELRPRLGVQQIVGADVTPESRRRFDESVASLGLLREVLARRGAPLVLLQYEEGDYAWILRQRLARARIDLPVVPLFRGVPPEMMLGDDPHPNAVAIEIAAGWVADELLARGWVGGGGGAPARADTAVGAAPGTTAGTAPGMDGADALRGRLYAPHVVEALAEASRERARAAMRDAVDFRDLTGVWQVYGTVNDDGSAAMRLAAGLARTGERLHVMLDAVPERPDLYPLRVEVSVDGRRVGELVIPPGGRGSGEFELPPASLRAETIDVWLRPARWVVRTIEGEPRPVSFLPVRIASTR